MQALNGDINFCVVICG